MESDIFAEGSGGGSGGGGVRRGGGRPVLAKKVGKRIAKKKALSPSALRRKEAQSIGRAIRAGQKKWKKANPNHRPITQWPKGMNINIS